MSTNPKAFGVESTKYDKTTDSDGSNGNDKVDGGPVRKKTELSDFRETLVSCKNWIMEHLEPPPEPVADTNAVAAGATATTLLAVPATGVPGALAVPSGPGMLSLVAC